MSDSEPVFDRRPILLVDHHDDYRSDLARALQSAGLVVVQADTTLRALAVLDRSPSIRLAVIAVLMPPGQPHGVALARIMRWRDARARIVLISEDSIVLDAPDMAHFRALSKMPDPASMAVTIANLLA